VTDPEPHAAGRQPLGEIFLVFLRLGLTSFGGPIAHLGYFREEFVARRKWVGERAYADLVALCQFLPGPASSQVGIGIGLAKGGIRGAVAAWIGFTAPSALALILFGLSIAAYGEFRTPASSTASRWSRSRWSRRRYGASRVGSVPTRHARRSRCSRRSPRSRRRRRSDRSASSRVAVS
jgi:hypothetical protein